MSGILLLDSILDRFKTSYPYGLSDDKLFEFYCADNLLTNYDLDNDEIESGIIDGPRDAGIDAAYLLINRRLFTEDFKFSDVKGSVDIELFLIQSKNQDSFKEGPLDKLSSSLPLLLDPTRQREALEPLFKGKAVAICQDFLGAIRQLAGEFPNVYLKVFYCCKGTEPNPTIKAKADSLGAILKSKCNSVEVTLLGAQQLYERSSKQKRLVKQLPTWGSPLSGTNSYVSLCKITDYVKFISDDDGKLITRIFDANVRAYQGEVEVNREIASSIITPTQGVDFWWLNNGVTIVADQAQFLNNSLSIENPLVVNGLQTSHELHRQMVSIDPDDGRMVLVRVIVENDRVKRDEIIRATNRQTHLKHSSFRATEAIHRELEDYLATLGFFYDRRKNFYKREGKPADRIVSIDRLAQAVLSVLLSKPHVARARPTTAIKDEDDYRAIFSGDKAKHPLEMYGMIIQMLSAVEGYFRSISDQNNQSFRNNLKFHVLMVLAWSMNGSTITPALRIPQIKKSRLTLDRIKAVTNWVFSEFDSVGGEDRTAKDSAFTDRLRTSWKQDLTEPAEQ